MPEASQVGPTAQAPAAPSSEADALPAPQPVPLHEAVVFLARFLGTPVQVDRVRDGMSALAGDGLAPPEPEALQGLLRHAGLVSSPLKEGQRRRPTEMPALVLGGSGSAIVVLAIKDGRFECHLPGIEGSSWLTAADIETEAPGAAWLAVRPLLHFDERSLLYTLPAAGRWFWDTFNRNRWMFGWALVGTLVINLFGALVPFYAMAVYDRVIPNNAFNSLGVLTTAAVVILGFEFVMRLLRSHLLESAARRIDVALSAKVFAQCLAMRAASRPASGGVLANTVRDFEAVRDFFATATLTVLGDLPFMLLFVAVIALVGGWLVLVPLIAIPLLIGIAWAARRPLAKRVNEGMQESTQRTAHLFETMNGLDTVKALGAETWSRRKWEGLTQAIAHNTLQTRDIVARVNYLNTMVLGIATIAVVAGGALLVGMQAMTLGQIIAVSLLTGRALAPAGQLAGLIVRWEQTRLSYEALDKIMAAETDDAAASLQAPPLSGALEFREVDFAYPGQPKLLERLSMTVRPGERVGIIGKLGSGKSTVLKLLLNQYGPASGSVLVDDLVATQLEPLSLRRQIGYVPQDVTLFHGSMRENIELGRVQASDSALLLAMQTACLDEIVTQLPQGVGTQVGERGERLSGGQRQTVAIARALLTRPKLLLLDEPSSMIDPATEQKLISRLRALQGTTIVLVTHRMAMLALVDRLIVMDRGRIVADGPRDEVLKALAQPQRPRETGTTAPASPVAPGAAPAVTRETAARGVARTGVAS
jgi:ATP-binding cassette subfamily C protein LapB